MWINILIYICVWGGGLYWNRMPHAHLSLAPTGKLFQLAVPIAALCSARCLSLLSLTFYSSVWVLAPLSNNTILSLVHSHHRRFTASQRVDSSTQIYPVCTLKCLEMSLA